MKKKWTVKERKGGMWEKDLKFLQGVDAVVVKKPRPAWLKFIVQTVVFMVGMLLFGLVVGLISGRW